MLAQVRLVCPIPPAKRRHLLDQMAKQYACLKDGCVEIFESWGVARRHMQQCGVDCKKKMQESALKAQDLNPLEAKDDGFGGKLKTDYPPTEDELVDFVRNYYARVPARCKKHVLDELRKVYGHFEFGMFGFGTFVEWSRRHGLCTRDPVDFRARPY